MALGEDLLESIPVVGGLFGAGRARSARKRYLEQLRELSKAYDSLQGDRALTNLEMGPTAFEGVSADPEAVQAQREALRYIQNVQAQGGLTPEDRARLLDIQDQQSEFERSQREGILASAAQRGVSGSGQELLAQLAANQSGAMQASRQGLQAAALAQRRALEANQALAGQSSQMRGQSFAEQAQRAQAKDAVSRFNKEMLDRMYQNRLGLTNARVGAQLAPIEAQMTGSMADRKALAGVRGGLTQLGATALSGGFSGLGGGAATVPTMSVAKFVNPGSEQLAQYEDAAEDDLARISRRA